MRKNRIRLSESQLHRVIKESVRKVLREFDEYDEFDHNSDVGEDMGTWSLYNKVERGEISDAQLASMVKRHGAGDLENLYNILKGDNRYPKFEREMEMAKDWENEELNNRIDQNLGYGKYADAEHENGNRFEYPFNVLRKKGEKTIGKRIYNPVTMSDDGYEDEDKAFNGTRASLKKYGY